MDDDPTAARIADRAAFQGLAREHHRNLLVFARALCGQEATAADLVQDALVTAWRNLERFDFQRDFGAWLRGIIRNKWREHLRRHTREVDVDEATLEAWEARFAQWDRAREGGSDLLDALDECLKRLPDTLRDLVRRFYFLNEPGERIADNIGIDKVTFRKRLQRVRELLRDCLEHKLQTKA